MLGGESKMDKNSKLVKTMYNMVLKVADVSVNSTCYFRFYQEKMNPQLNTLKKYHEE